MQLIQQEGLIPTGAVRLGTGAAPASGILVRLLAIAGAVTAIVFSGHASSAQAPLPEVLGAALKRVSIPESAASFYVVPVEGGHPLYAQNAQQAMNPASTMKLVTTFSALELLGPAYTWKTRAYVSAAPINGVLVGDLYLRGGGDPHLMQEDLWLFVSALRGRGIQEIRGDVLIDRSLFAPAAYDPAQFDQEPLRPYNVGPDAFLANFKAIVLHFIPDEQRRTVRVYATPSMPDMTLGEVHYLDGSCGDYRARLGADFSDPIHIHFNGGYPGSCGERDYPVSLFSHMEYDSQVLKGLFGELGVNLVGHIREGPTPAGADLFYQQESPPLAEVVRDINKFSNNVMARELFLTLAAESGPGPASADAASKVENDFLASANLAMPELVLDNGSGLSRSERISAASMARLLLAAWNSAVMPEFISSFPVVGLDGTMRHRLTGESVAGQAHIKTGTLNDTRAVAGYVLSASGRRYVVVSFINHPNAYAAQGVQDTLLQWVYEHG